MSNSASIHIIYLSYYQTLTSKHLHHIVQRVCRILELMLFSRAASEASRCLFLSSDTSAVTKTEPVTSLNSLSIHKASMSSSLTSVCSVYVSVSLHFLSEEHLAHFDEEVISRYQYFYILHFIHPPSYQFTDLSAFIHQTSLPSIYLFVLLECCL